MLMLRRNAAQLVILALRVLAHFEVGIQNGVSYSRQEVKPNKVVLQWSIQSKVFQSTQARSFDGE
jgi:hypothetical protein